MSVEQAHQDDATFEIPPTPQEMDSPCGKMIVYEGQLSGFSIQAPADWIEQWPDDEDSTEIFLATTPEGEGIVIKE